MSPDLETGKRRAAEAALAEVRSGMVLGLGTGSTVDHLLDLLEEALASGALRDLVAVPTSVRTERRARELGIVLADLGDHESLDLAIDGADEIGPGLDLVKGAGGALLREKMVAQAAERFVVIADDSKRVGRLGTRAALPVEVLRWGWRAHARFLERHGAEVSVRSRRDGGPVESDNGNVLLDARFPDGIEDPQALEASLSARAGILETGLFLGLADRAYVAGPQGVEILERAR
ncbi:MAG TPA: ribose 5-phosphate isomerase A [Longimicrobiales bacterium]|nr:ribose 5-phosphate isomerase A [Longimicrobiales bacterium]